MLLVKAAFPEARVIATTATIAAITGSVDAKLAQLKENGPPTLADVVMSEAFDDPVLSLDGHTIEIADVDGLVTRAGQPTLASGRA